MSHDGAAGPEMVSVDGAWFVRGIDGDWRPAAGQAAGGGGDGFSGRRDRCVSVDGALFDLDAGVWRQAEPADPTGPGRAAVADGYVSVDGVLIRVEIEPD